MINKKENMKEQPRREEIRTCCICGKKYLYIEDTDGCYIDKCLPQHVCCECYDEYGSYWREEF